MFSINNIATINGFKGKKRNFFAWIPNTGGAVVLVQVGRGTFPERTLLLDKHCRLAKDRYEKCVKRRTVGNKVGRDTEIFVTGVGEKCNRRKKEINM
jgi:hypothetical protein